MRYTDDALYPENMAPLIISAAPYGPTSAQTASPRASFSSRRHGRSVTGCCPASFLPSE